MPPLPYLSRIPGVDAQPAARAIPIPRCGTASIRIPDAVQPRPAGLPPARGRGERAAGAAADQLQGRALRSDPHTACCASSARRRGRALRGERREDRAAGEAQGARLGIRAARQVVDAHRGQLSLRAARWRVLHPGRGARRSRGLDTVYNWVVELCVSLGANRDDLVPFEKYANAAKSLGSPSSAARALAAGAQTSNASTASSSRWRRRRACAWQRWTRSSPSSTPGWSGTGTKVEGCLGERRYTLPKDPMRAHASALLLFSALAAAQGVPTVPVDFLRLPGGAAHRGAA